MKLSYQPDVRDRVRIYYLSERDLLVLLEWRRFECIRLPRFANLPEDGEIVRVSYDFSRRAFALLIQSETFEPIMRTAEIPSHELGDVVMEAFQRQPDGSFVAAGSEPTVRPRFISGDPR